MDKEKSFLYTLNQRGKYRAHDCLLENNSYTLATTNRKKKNHRTRQSEWNSTIKSTRQIKVFWSWNKKEKKILLAIGLFLVHSSMNGEVDFKR